MEKYIRERLSILRPGMSGDDQLTVLHEIYDELESVGYTSRAVKDLVDAVIRENIMELRCQLDEECADTFQRNA